jgi:hypothetical protein
MVNTTGVARSGSRATSSIRLALTAFCLAIVGCSRSGRAPLGTPAASFDSDLDFLQRHTSIVVLADSRRDSRVAVAPAYQGRVMTSTTGGSGRTVAPSFGWIGRAAIQSGARQPHMNVFGGEDRFWLGPEGGQYALYFKAGDPFDLDHWQVPDAIDWGAWDVADRSQTSVRVRKRISLVNYAGTRFDLDVDRTVRLLTEDEVAAQLGVSPATAVFMVAFESSNTVANIGRASWQPESGLVSVWILGMFNPSLQTTIALPIAPGPESTLGPVVNDAYFGRVPADRLVVKESIVLFRGDGQHRSKIGLPPSRALPFAGSYDAAAHALTLVQYTRPAGATRYVNSMWESQREPYQGDVVNSYNDGPPAPGKPPLGPFYEIETSSPALDLAPGQRYTHVHRTFHFLGAEADLDPLARATLKVGVAELRSAFGPASR